MFKHFLRIYKENESLELDAVQGQDRGNVPLELSVNFCVFPLCFKKKRGLICQIIGLLKKHIHVLPLGASLKYDKCSPS